MKTRLLAACITTLLLCTATSGYAITLTAGTKTCITGCSLAGGPDNQSLVVGDAYRWSNTNFIDGNSTLFDVIVEITGASGTPNNQFTPSGVDATSPNYLRLHERGIESFDEGWVSYDISFVLAGTDTSHTIAGSNLVSILDIDSSTAPGQENLSDVAGVSINGTAPILTLGADLEASGFQAMNGAPTNGFTYARVDPASVGAPTDWADEQNLSNNPVHTATFKANGDLSEFQLVWGWTGSEPSQAAKRGWSLELEDSPEISSVPLPASAFLLLAGVAGLGSIARRRKKPV